MFIGIPKKLSVSTEAISFQGASKFAIELTKLFQSVMDYRDSVRGKTKNIKSDVYNYHIKNVPEKFKKIVKKYTGVDIKNFETSLSPSFGYACLMSFGTDLEKGNTLAMNAIAKYSGNQEDELYGYVPESEEDIEKALENVSSTIDVVKGKLNKSEFTGIDKVEGIWANVYFCYISAYLAKDVLHEKSPEFTAQELAAIMLHEVGHLLSAVEHAADLVRTHQSIMDTVSVEKLVDPDVKSIARAAAKGASKTSFKEDVQMLDKLEQSASNIEDVKKESGIIGKAFAVLGSLISTALILVLSFIGMIFWRAFMLIFGSGLELSEVISMYKNKRSDFMSNFGDNCLCERYADEYVSRHGFAKHQVLALSKLGDMVTSYYASLGGMSTGGRESTICYIIAQFRSYLVMNMFGVGEDTTGDYENEARRALSMLRDVVKVFKDDGMPPDLVDFYIKNYEETEAAIKKTVSNNATSKFTAINIFLTKTISLTGLIKLLVAGRADSNYKKLMDATQEIVSTKFHYYKAKLDQIYRNM